MPAITTQNAREMQRLSVEARKLRDAIPANTPSDYSEERLLRVREQLTKIDEMIAEETDPSKLDRLASASARLAEQERQLAGRPLPGSLRPSSKPQRQPIHNIAPIGVEPVKPPDTNVQ